MFFGKCFWKKIASINFSNFVFLQTFTKLIFTNLADIFLTYISLLNVFKIFKACEYDLEINELEDSFFSQVVTNPKLTAFEKLLSDLNERGVYGEKNEKKL